MSPAERIEALCLALPEAAVERSGNHAGFTVRRRRFAWFLDDHHGDGVAGVVFKALPGEGEALLEAGRDRFYRPAYLGSRGWVGVRLDTPAVDWDEVAELLADSYRLVAPKRLAEQV